ncbi:MAG TPA: DinB family protein [Candidatus Sulfotelmatobacter sp.]|nr:DinB family protein [Candidatus Sulfotelmatobacter sp.]
MKRILVTLLFASAALSFAQTQTMAVPAPKTTPAASPAGPVKDPVSTSLRMMLPGRQKNILAAIEAMPADKFSYKPTPDQMSFAHLVIHITESNNGLCAKATDVPAPKADELKETDSKDKLLAATKVSFDFCSEALSKMDDSKLGDSVELFGGRQFPRAMAAIAIASGWADHYAAAAMYLRLNGILPPSAQPKK